MRGAKRANLFAKAAGPESGPLRAWRRGGRGSARAPASASGALASSPPRISTASATSTTRGAPPR
eukprot:2582008-Lingulodinium_polyedra.AAC.1